MGCASSCTGSNNYVAVTQGMNDHNRPLSPKTEAVLAKLKQVQMNGDDGGDIHESPESSPPDSPRLHVKPTTHEVVFGDKKRMARDPAEFQSWTEMLLQAEAQRKPLNPDLERDLLSGMALGRLAPLHLWKKAVKGNTVRVFFSGPAEDTDKEQDIFFEDCVPYMRAAATVVGLEYESHDLRLGYNVEDRSNHRVRPERQREIERCLRSSLGLSFVGLVGDKYGARQFPISIEAGLFHRIVALFGVPVPYSGDVSRTSSTEVYQAKEPRADKETLESWFELDCNCTPAMYRLVPIHHKLQAFDGSMGRRAQHSAEEQYKKRVLAPISRTLRDIAEAGIAEGSLSRPEAEPFQCSAAAAELGVGIVHQAELDGGHAKNSALFLRSFKGLANRLGDTGAALYMDLLRSKNRDEDAEAMLKGLRQALARCIKPDKLVTLSLPWREGGIHPERHKDHRTYLSQFSEKCIEVQIYGIAEGLRERPLVRELAAELAEHLLIAEEKVGSSTGRTEHITAIRKFLSSQSKNAVLKGLSPTRSANSNSTASRGSSTSRILVLIGPEGSGKGSLLAAACQRHMRYTDPVIHQNSNPMDLLSRLPSMRSLRGDAFQSAKNLTPSCTTSNAANGAAPVEGAAEASPPPSSDSNSAEPVLIMRFIGATRFSSHPADILYSIVQQLASVYGPPPAAVDPLFDERHGTPFIPESFEALAAALPLWLSLASPRRPLILCLCGLQNLQDSPELSWLPLNPPQHVTVLLSAALPPSAATSAPAGEPPSALLQRLLPAECILQVGPLSQDAIPLLKSFWLERAQRSMTPEQESAIDDALRYAKEHQGVTPLLLNLVLEQTKLWTSGTTGRQLHRQLIKTEEAAIRGLLESAEAGQPPGLVPLVVGGLAQTRGGLSVMELVDLANASSDLVRSVLKHANPSLTRPSQAVVPASRVLRILHRLEALVGERVVDGGRRLIQFRLPIYKRVAAQYATKVEDGGWRGSGTMAEGVADMMCGIVREVRAPPPSEGGTLIQQLLSAISSKRKPVLFSQDGLVAAWTEKGEMLRVNERRLQEAPRLLILLGRTRELHDMMTAPAAIWHMCSGMRRLEYGRYWRHLENLYGHQKLVEACCLGLQDFSKKPGCVNQATMIALQLSDFILCHLNQPESAGRVAQLTLIVGGRCGIEIVSSCLLARARCLLAQSRHAEALGVMREGVRAWNEVGFTLPQRLIAANNVSFRKALQADPKHHVHRRASHQVAQQGGMRREGSNLGAYAEELSRMKEEDEEKERKMNEGEQATEQEDSMNGSAAERPDRKSVV